MTATATRNSTTASGRAASKDKDTAERRQAGSESAKQSSFSKIALSNNQKQSKQDGEGAAESSQQNQKKTANVLEGRQQKKTKAKNAAIRISTCSKDDNSNGKSGQKRRIGNQTAVLLP